MAFISKLRLRGHAIQYALIVIIALLAFLTFNVLFNASTADDYPREILAALIGTLMAAVITTLLLKQQSVGEEIKERNVEVFRRKIEAYNGFIEYSLQHQRDYVTSNEEAFDLRNRVYGIALLSAASTVDSVTSFLRGRFSGDLDISIEEVVYAFRADLGLDKLEEGALLDMEAIDEQLKGVINRASIEADCESLNSVIDSLKEALVRYDYKLFSDLETGNATGSGSGAKSYLFRRPGTVYYLEHTYGSTLQRVVLQGYLELSEMPLREQKRLQSLACSLHFYDDTQTTEWASFLLAPDPNTASGGESEGRRVLTMAELVEAVTRIENAADARGMRPLKADPDA